VQTTDVQCSTGQSEFSTEDKKRRRKESRAKFLDGIRDSLESVKHQLAFTIPEASLLCGKSPTWGYRRVYSGEWRVTNRDGRLLIPASEIAHFVSGVEKYNPAPKNGVEKNGHT
jgi:hypothetical protein